VSIIKVNYRVFSNSYSIRKELSKVLSDYAFLSFDTEVRSLYNKDERSEAKKYLKEAKTDDYYYKQARVVSESSGLSYPEITETTHFILGISEDFSYIFVCRDHATEKFIWNKLAEYEGTIAVHNSLFDLKIMYERTGKLPKNFVDTALKVKCLINHVNIWKSKTGLKELMGSYYSPKWSLMDDYEPEDLKNKDFLMYAAIDGAATFKLHSMIDEELKNYKE